MPNYYTTLPEPYILHNVIFLMYVTFYQINKFFIIFVNLVFLIIDKMSLRGRFGPRAVV